MSFQATRLDFTRNSGYCPTNRCAVLCVVADGVNRRLQTARCVAGWAAHLCNSCFCSSIRLQTAQCVAGWAAAGCPTGNTQILAKSEAMRIERNVYMTLVTDKNKQ